jgi:hypothetical protein
MPRSSKTNVPAEELAWSIERASAEFGLSPMTLRRALAKISAKPDENGCYTTQQVVTSLFGELHVQKVRVQRAVAHKLELENAVTEGRLLDRDALARGLGAIASAFVARLMAANELPRTLREDLCRELSSWPLALREVERAQSRFRGGNGQTIEEDGSES